MTKEIRCAEVGFFPDCPGVMHGETEDEVMAATGRHGADVHSMTEADFTPDVVATVKASIRDA